MARIVICDGDVQAGRFLRLVLHGQAYEVEMVHTAADCLAACAQSWPHLVVTDLTLSDMDGCALIRRLRIARPTLPILALSGSGDDLLRAGWQSGADRVLSKPIAPALLLSTTAHLIAALNAPP